MKMVHNGIEYGLMQAYAEGFEVLKASEFGLDLHEVEEILTDVRARSSVARPHAPIPARPAPPAAAASARQTRTSPRPAPREISPE